jgi:hypothetical protein
MGQPAAGFDLGQDKLFRLDTSTEATTPVEARKQSARPIEFFWLCNPCVAEMTLSYRKGLELPLCPGRRRRDSQHRIRNSAGGGALFPGSSVLSAQCVPTNLQHLQKHLGSIPQRTDAGTFTMGP